MIPVVATDWDGTCVDSVKAKTVAFGTTFEEHLPEAKHKRHLAEAIYRVTGGTNRKYQLAAAAAIANVPMLEGAAYNAWSADFTAEYMRSKPELFPDVAPALKELKRRGTYLVLSSSVPQPDLEATLDRYPELTGVFNQVYGTADNGAFHKGRPHLARASTLTGVPISRMLFIGDMVEDIELGTEAGAITVARLPVNDSGLMKLLVASNPQYYIKTFAELLDIIT